jgi:hypothetical protein
MGKKVNLIGQTFGNLFVLERFGVDRKDGVQWLCRCACGNEAIRSTRGLRRMTRGICAACEAKRLHGGTKTKDGPRDALYKTWQSMRERCEKAGHRFYHCYGGKGVTVCAEWQSYPAFRDWAIANGYESRPDLPLGDRPSIDRIDSSGNYCPENCRIIRHRDNAKRHKYEESTSVH